MDGARDHDELAVVCICLFVARRANNDVLGIIGRSDGQTPMNPPGTTSVLPVPRWSTNKSEKYYSIAQQRKTDRGVQTPSDGNPQPNTIIKVYSRTMNCCRCKAQTGDPEEPVSQASQYLQICAYSHASKGVPVRALSCSCWNCTISHNTLSTRSTDEVSVRRNSTTGRNLCAVPANRPSCLGVDTGTVTRRDPRPPQQHDSGKMHG